MILKLPDVRNPTHPCYACGKVSALCVLRYYGLPDSCADRLIPTPNGGVTPKQLEDTLTLAGLSVVRGKWTVDMLKNIKVPVITFINDKASFLDHYTVFGGISRGRVRFFDPDCGNTSMPLDDYIARWSSIDKHGNLYIRGGIACGKD